MEEQREMVSHCCGYGCGWFLQGDEEGNGMETAVVTRGGSPGSPGWGDNGSDIVDGVSA